MLLSFCAENDLIITKTLFGQADKYKTTWMHPRSKQLHLIDCAIYCRRDIFDVRITRTVGRGGGGWSVGLTTASSSLSCHCTSLQRVARLKFCRPAFDTAKLKQLERSRMFAKDLDDRLTAHRPLSGPPPQQWEQFKTLVAESDKLTIGPMKKVRQDWFDENDERIKELLDDKKKAFIEWQNDISSTSKRDHFKHLQRLAQTHFAECRTSGGGRRPTNSKPMLPQRTPKCCSAPSKKSTTLPSHAPCRSCQLTAQPSLRRRAASTQGWGNTSVPYSTDPPLSRLDQIPQKPIDHQPWPPPCDWWSFQSNQTDQLRKIPWDGRDSCWDLQASRSSGPRSTPLTPHQHLGRRGCAQRSQECHIHLPV